VAWDIRAARAAQKQLVRFPARDREKIGAALRSLEAGLFSGDIIKLEDAGNRWRRRVGNYRIFFAVRHRRQDSGHHRDCPPHVNDVLSFP